jgi:hypothetical protein
MKEDAVDHPQLLTDRLDEHSSAQHSSQLKASTSRSLMCQSPTYSMSRSNKGFKTPVFYKKYSPHYHRNQQTVRSTCYSEAEVQKHSCSKLPFLLPSPKIVVIPTWQKSIILAAHFDAFKQFFQTFLITLIFFVV